jgi:hypothetical protein
MHCAQEKLQQTESYSPHFVQRKDFTSVWDVSSSLVQKKSLVKKLQPMGVFKTLYSTLAEMRDDSLCAGLFRSRSPAAHHARKALETVLTYGLQVDLRRWTTRLGG